MQSYTEYIKSYLHIGDKNNYENTLNKNLVMF